MKRLVVLALVCSSMLILTACGKKDKASKVDSTQILATTDDHTLSTPEKEAIDAAVETAKTPITSVEELDGEVATNSASDSALVVDSTEYIAAYKEALKTFASDYTLPSGQFLFEEEIPSDDYFDTFGAMEDNVFAIEDVDEDGKPELIIQFSTAPTVGMIEGVYEYIPSSGDFHEEITLYPGAGYYTGGLIKSEWSHNPGLAGDELWPYSLLDYDKESDTYDFAGQADSWSKEIHPEDFEGIKFPDDVDTDNVGVVYDISYGEEYKGGYLYSQSDFDEFENKIFSEHSEIKLDYKKLTDENISALE